MLAMVCSRRKNDFTYIEIKVDIDYEEYLTFAINKSTHMKTHVYYFDSLSTTVREFRTIKCSEFYPTADIIINPQRSLEVREQRVD